MLAEQVSSFVLEVLQPARHPSFSLYIPALSSYPCPPFIHSSIHTFLLSLLCQHPCSLLSWWKILRIITYCALHTLWLSVAPPLSSPVLKHSFFFPLFWGERNKSRAGKKENRRQCREKGRTNMSQIRERIDGKDRWGDIKWKVGAYSATGLPIGSGLELHCGIELRSLKPPSIPSIDVRQKLMLMFLSVWTVFSFIK